MKTRFRPPPTKPQRLWGRRRVYLEKFLSPVKHIEMQIICDDHGNVVCLGERDCSVQRKNQKLIEESPSPAVTPDIRQRWWRCPLRRRKPCGYRGVGTIEFLFDRDNHFYFMEMNTRLQVEHPVTEMVTGIDLVKWQIRVASGLPLSFTQKDIKIEGAAIECRINAEDPDNNFRPSCGRITLLHVPGGPWVRFDTALYQDYFVPPFYDSMMGKLIVYAKTREEAIRKMQAALCELVIEGVEHNSELQMDILSDEEFKSGRYYTNFMDAGKEDRRMLKKSLFKRRKTSWKPTTQAYQNRTPHVPDEMCITCPSCRAMLFTSELKRQSSRLPQVRPSFPGKRPPAHQYDCGRRHLFGDGRGLAVGKPHRLSPL